MGDLQVDLNAALVAVKKKCVDLEETIKREDTKPQNRGRGYLGVKRYIYAVTTKNSENSLNRRGRSLTRVYVEQKFYRSKSVPSPDQVHRLEDCTQDYNGPNGEERLEFTETIEAPLEELIKEDQSHHHMVSEKIPHGHGEWDHELAVYEEDGDSGLLEDRTLTVRAGDHPFGMNQFQNADEVSQKIAEFFGSTREEENMIRSREMSLSVHPVYHDALGSGAYTSFGMSKSKSKSSGNLHSNSARLDSIYKTTNSLSNLYTEQTRHDHESRYGHYVTGYGRYGALEPPKNPEVMPKLPKVTKVEKTEHVYAEPIVNRRDTVIFKPAQPAQAPVAPAPAPVVTTTTTNYETRLYERKYDFRTTFPPDVELPEGYHDYYDPSKFMFLDSQGYYQGNITRPLHYNYGRDTFEKYSDYSGSRRASPMPPVEPEPVYIVLQRAQDLPKSQIHVSNYPDYYDQSSRIILSHSKDPEHLEFEFENFAPHPEYYDNAARIILHYSRDLEHLELKVAEHPEYYDLATRYQNLERTYDIVHEPILVEEYPAYKPYEVQEVLIDLDEEEPIYEEIYEPVIVLQYQKDLEHTVYSPEVPYYPPPPPPPVEEIIHVAVPAKIIEEVEDLEPPIPAQRHLDELYIGQEALDVSVSPTFGKVTDQKNLGLEKSVHDRVREMEVSMRSDDRERVEEIERRRRFEQRQAEIREARTVEDAYEEVVEERKNTPAPQPIHVPDVFIMPEKPKRTWQPPPKLDLQLDEHEDKPLGPVIFHELIYQQGILRQKFQEEHSVTARPVAHPVSRATSRPSTPGPEFREIDFPRLEESRGHTDSAGNVDYVQKHIERYNANDAQDSSESRHQTHVHTVSVEHKEHHHHHHHHHDHAHRESVVYDEPSRESVVYDVPHEEHHHHHKSEHHHKSHKHSEHHKELEEHQHLEQLKLQQQAAELQYQLAQTNQAIRQMSKSNKWAESEVIKSSASTTVNAQSSVLHHSSSLNRQNIPAPLTIQNGNERHSSHELHHVHYSEDSENHQHHHQHHHHDHQLHTTKSTTSLEYSPVHVGHVKSLALKFNKVDEKPISTEQVIYRVRAAPPGHHFQQDVKPRPRSLPHVPLDEVELHEHGARDHMTRHHQEHVKEHQDHIGGGVTVESHDTTGIGGGVTVHHGATTRHNSYYHTVGGDEEPTVKVRRVYKALEDTSMLSPVSMTHDEILYDVPTDGF